MECYGDCTHMGNNGHEPRSRKSKQNVLQKRVPSSHSFVSSRDVGKS